MSTIGQEPEPLEASTGRSAVQVARLVRSGALSAEQVVAEHLQVVALADPALNALVLVDDTATAQARAVDEALARGVDPGPLAGVPVVVKDNIDVRGQTTASGSRAHGDAVALRDATVVRRLRDAGAIVLGRANMDELAMGASTRTSAYGPTRNPVDTRRSPGGSSGGSAAAVAARMSPLALGTDTGGSIREPAAQCGVWGMAASPRLVPMRGVVPFAPRLDRVGPLARSADDLRLLLDCLAGGRLGTPEDVGERPRVGVVTELVGPRNQPGVLACLEQVLVRVRELGLEVSHVSVPEAGRSLSTYTAITSAAMVASLEPYVRTGNAGPEVVRRHALGRALLARDGGELEAARAARARLRSQLRVALDRYDVLLSPTMPTTAPMLFGEISADDLADPMAAPYTDCWTVVANLAGLPALSMPAGNSREDDMPVGAMLMGRPGHDALLVALAGRIAGDPA